MMDEEQLNCYRINYNVEFWTGVAEKVGNQCSSPVGAVLAVNALCDEIERLRQERDYWERNANEMNAHWKKELAAVTDEQSVLKAHLKLSQDSDLDARRENVKLLNELTLCQQERDELKRMCHTQTLLIQKLEDQLFKGQS